MTNHNIKTIDVHELKKRMDADPALHLIDVREDDEWEEVHIHGALHMPKDQITTLIEHKIPDHNAQIYLHCKGGVRSMYAAQCLKDMGYKNLYSIDGGIADWERCGYPVKK